MAKDPNAMKIVGLLIEVANADTVYRDLYLSRARLLLSATLDESAYKAIASIDKEIEDLMRRSRSAALQREAGDTIVVAAHPDVVADAHGRAHGLHRGCLIGAAESSEG